MAPITLSKQAFLTKKPGGDYSKYLSYVNNARSKKLGAQKTDPFAPMSPQDISSVIDKFTGMYGTPLSDKDIESRAHGQIDPIIAAITKSATDRANSSSTALRGLSDSYAKELGGINFGAPYSTAMGEQAAVDAALNDVQKTGGSDLASQLRSRLGAIGSDPAVAQAASGLEQQGADQGATQVAYGSNALSELIRDKASASSYGQKLPGIARLAGLQDIAGVEASARNQINEGTQSALSQLPAIVQALRSSNDNLRGNRASAAANLYTTLTGQNVTKATAKAGLDNQAFDNNLAYAGTYGYDPNTGQPAAGYKYDNNGNIVPIPKPSTVKPKPTGDAALTTDDRRNLLKDLNVWTGGSPARRVKSKDSPSGFVKVPGTGSKPLPWEEVVNNLMTSYNLSRKEAEKYASKKYKPGQHGRPYPVPPPAGTEPLSPTTVVDQRGGIYKLIDGKWRQQMSLRKDYPNGG